MQRIIAPIREHIVERWRTSPQGKAAVIIGGLIMTCLTIWVCLVNIIPGWDDAGEAQRSTQASADTTAASDTPEVTGVPASAMRATQTPRPTSTPRPSRTPRPTSTPESVTMAEYLGEFQVAYSDYLADNAELNELLRLSIQSNSLSDDRQWVGQVAAVTRRLEDSALALEEIEAPAEAQDIDARLDQMLRRCATSYQMMRKFYRERDLAAGKRASDGLQACNTLWERLMPDLNALMVAASLPPLEMPMPTPTAAGALPASTRPGSPATSQPTAAYQPTVALPTWTPVPAVLPTWTPAPAARPTEPPPAVVEPTQPPPPPAAVCDCSANIYNCGDFSSHNSAQACFGYCWEQVGYDVHRLDGDNDGIACEDLP